MQEFLHPFIHKMALVDKTIFPPIISSTSLFSADHAQPYEMHSNQSLDQHPKMKNVPIRLIETSTHMQPVYQSRTLWSTVSLNQDDATIID